jgi:hypothetical protein
MRGEQINRVSGKILIALSFTALIAVLSGYFQPPQPDEGTAATSFSFPSWRSCRRSYCSSSPRIGNSPYAARDS